MEIDEEKAVPLERSRGPVRKSPKKSPKKETGRNSNPAGSSPSVGAMLREARGKNGLSVLEVAERLFLTEHYVHALEAGEYDKLPSEVYVRGYIKSYAQLLRLDAEQVMNAYRQPGAPVVDDDRPLRAMPESSGRDWMVPLLLVLLAGAVAAAAWWAYQAFFAGGAGFLAVGAAMQGAQQENRQ